MIEEDRPFRFQMRADIIAAGCRQLMSGLEVLADLSEFYDNDSPEIRKEVLTLTTGVAVTRASIGNLLAGLDDLAARSGLDTVQARFDEFDPGEVEVAKAAWQERVTGDMQMAGLIIQK